MIGRFASTLGLVNFLRLFGHKPSANNRELFFLCYAGFIRGAVAFGLVLRVDEGENRSVIVTTSLTCVMLSIMIFGGTVGMLGNCLFGKDGGQVITEEENINERLLADPINESDEKPKL